MGVDIDVIVDADATQAPFGEHIGMFRQGFESGPIELFEQLAPGDAEPPDPPFFVEAPEQLADRRIDLREIMEDAVA